jgi:hypothetical protein
MSEPYIAQSQGDKWLPGKFNDPMERLGKIEGVGIYPVQNGSYYMVKIGVLYYARDGQSGKIGAGYANPRALLTDLGSAVYAAGGGTIYAKNSDYSMDATWPSSDLSDRVMLKGEGRRTRFLASGGADALNPEYVQIIDLVWQDAGLVLHDATFDPNMFENVLKLMAREWSPYVKHVFYANLLLSDLLTLCYTEDEDEVVISAPGSSVVARVNRDTYEAVWQRLDFKPLGIGYWPPTHKLYAADQTHGGFKVIDGDTGLDIKSVTSSDLGPLGTQIWQIEPMPGQGDNHVMFGDCDKYVAGTMDVDTETYDWYFGVYNTPGSDASHLDRPRGFLDIATDRKIIADWFNDRVLVVNNAKSILAMMPFPRPCGVTMPMNLAGSALAIDAMFTSETHYQPIALYMHDAGDMSYTGEISSVPIASNPVHFNPHYRPTLVGTIAQWSLLMEVDFSEPNPTWLKQMAVASWVPTDHTNNMLYKRAMAGGTTYYSCPIIGLHFGTQIWTAYATKAVTVTVQVPSNLRRHLWSENELINWVDYAAGTAVGDTTFVRSVLSPPPSVWRLKIVVGGDATAITINFEQRGYMP